MLLQNRDSQAWLCGAGGKPAKAGDRAAAHSLHTAGTAGEAEPRSPCPGPCLNSASVSPEAEH